ncbi:ATP-binding protein [Streptomyces sp. NPDC058279]|uniref:ATP-binding protein n=1 Tax=Streptomyces sp. NPDC058279 TaxID=3346418 RepID=UPI0036ED7B96
MNPPTITDNTCRPTRRRGSPTSHPPGPPTTAAAARHRLSALLQRAGISLDSVTAADALMVGSELVVNAIQHGGGITAFHSDIADDTLHLTVADKNPRAPSTRIVIPGRPGGYGWPLVQRLTQRIRITTHPHGKTISVDLRLT